MEKMAFLWGVFGFALILAGVVPGLSGWARVLSPRTCVALIMLLIVLLWLLYAMSITISDLSAKTQELAMQVSLLNNENEQLIKQMKNLTKEQEKRR
jgi:predicted PurR-regulated permease PerM